MALPVGSRLGPYEIGAPLGAGGMGVSGHRHGSTARSPSRSCRSSLAADPRFRDRFDCEARAVSKLAHPHICSLHDVGEHDRTAFLVMEYLEGETLAERLTRGPLPIEQALRADTISSAWSRPREATAFIRVPG